ncbi:MAG TPA: extracellular solute-binding protein [Telmatospirillum sp.]|nr:extracellular solute-binding protein [Telmatospirillum sp.]
MRFICFTTLFALLTVTGALAGQAVPAVALFGEPKYGASFDHFDYANPDAPKGGLLRLYQLGAFDTLNPFSDRGTPPLARGTTARPIDVIGLTFDSLLVRSADEPASAYGLIAESIEIDSGGHWVVFNLRPQARFHDGSAITADDVLFSFDILKSSGAPILRAPLQTVLRGEKLADRKVRFIFSSGEARSWPLVLGGLPILSKAWWQGRDFKKPVLEAPLGSGPYTVQSVDVGHHLVLARVTDYWAKDLPVARGLYNFDQIRTDFFADSALAFAAFKNDAYDVRYEFESKKWAMGYHFPAVEREQVVQHSFPNRRTEPMRGFAFNLRRPLWQDQRVRRAVILAFDFEALNKDLFYNQYQRSRSYFAKSELASSGLPSDDERTLLEPLRGQVAEDIFTKAYDLPNNGNPADRHRNLQEALRLLQDAGWVMKHGRLIDKQNGTPFTFQILVDDPSWQPICLTFVSALKHLGIHATIAAPEASQFTQRRDRFDFDMISAHWPASESPGLEQRAFWGSAAAEQPGSLNWTGLKSPAVDRIIDTLATSPDRKTLVSRVHVLDRLLLWSESVIPQWHMPSDHVAVWDKFGMPAVIPDQGAQLLTWWRAPDKAVTSTPQKKSAKGRS